LLAIFLPEAISQALPEQKILVDSHRQPRQGQSRLALGLLLFITQVAELLVAVNTLKNCTRHDESSPFLNSSVLSRLYIEVLVPLDEMASLGVRHAGAAQWECVCGAGRQQQCARAMHVIASCLNRFWF